jgi:hypothetical protein
MMDVYDRLIATFRRSQMKRAKSDDKGYSRLTPAIPSAYTFSGWLPVGPLYSQEGIRRKHGQHSVRRLTSLDITPDSIGRRIDRTYYA